MEPSERDGMIAFVRASSETLLMVENGDVVAASRTAATLLGGRSGAVIERLETIASSIDAKKLKAAQTRLRRKPVTRMASQGELGKIEFSLFRLSETGFFLQINLPEVASTPVSPGAAEEAPVVDGEKAERSDPAVDAVIAGGESEHRKSDDLALPGTWRDRSHPDLAEGYSRGLFQTQIEDSRAACRQGENALSLVMVSIEDALEKQPYWVERDAVKAVLARLNEVVRGHDVIAHLGGARFGIIQRFAKTDEELTFLCRRVIDALMDPFDEPLVPACVELSIARIYREPGDQSALDLVQALEVAITDGVHLCALGSWRAGGRARIVSLAELSAA